MATNTGTKKLARDRKNGASHDQWEKRKAQSNAARPKQTFIPIGVSDEGKVLGYMERVPA